MSLDDTGNLHLTNARSGKNLQTIPLNQSYFLGSHAGNHFVKLTWTHLIDDDSQQEPALYERRAGNDELARTITLDLNTRIVHAIAVSPDERYLAVASLEYHFYLLDLTEPDSEL